MLEYLAKQILLNRIGKLFFLFLFTNDCKQMGLTGPIIFICFLIRIFQTKSFHILYL